MDEPVRLASLTPIHHAVVDPPLPPQGVYPSPSDQGVGTLLNRWLMAASRRSFRPRSLSGGPQRRTLPPPPSASLASVADDRRPGTPIEIEKGKENEKKIKENCRLMQKKTRFFSLFKTQNPTLWRRVSTIDLGRASISKWKKNKVCLTLDVL